MIFMFESTFKACSIAYRAGFFVKIGMVHPETIARSDFLSGGQ